MIVDLTFGEVYDAPSRDRVHRENKRMTAAIAFLWPLNYKLARAGKLFQIM